MGHNFPDWGAVGEGYTCPVCDADVLDQPAWNGDRPSFDVCPACGIAFGAEDVDANGHLNYGAWKQWFEDWVARGAPWTSTAKAAPDSWEPMPRTQMLSVPNGRFRRGGFWSEFTCRVTPEGTFHFEPADWDVVVQPGGAGYSAACGTANASAAIVVSGGKAAWVDVSKHATPLPLNNLTYGLYPVPSLALILLNEHDKFAAIDAEGSTMWTSRSLAMCCDFRDMRVDNGHLTGMAEGSNDWYPFNLDLATGETTGGFWT
jgi:hypothetical protein